MLNTVSLADGYKSEGTGYTRAALCLSAFKPETRQDHAFVFKKFQRVGQQRWWIERGGALMIQLRK